MAQETEESKWGDAARASVSDQPKGEERPRFVALVPHPQRFCAVRLPGPRKTMFFADRPIIRLASVALNEEERTQPNQGFEPMLGFIWSSTRKGYRCTQWEDFSSLLKASGKPPESR